MKQQVFSEFIEEQERQKCRIFRRNSVCKDFSIFEISDLQLLSCQNRFRKVAMKVFLSILIKRFKHFECLIIVVIIVVILQLKLYLNLFNCLKSDFNYISSVMGWNSNFMSEKNISLQYFIFLFHFGFFIFKKIL